MNTEVAHIIGEVGIFGGNDTVYVAYDRPVRLIANCPAGLFDDGRTRISPTHRKLVQLARAACSSTM